MCRIWLTQFYTIEIVIEVHGVFDGFYIIYSGLKLKNVFLIFLWLNSKERLRDIEIKSEVFKNYPVNGQLVERLEKILAH